MNKIHKYTLNILTEKDQTLPYITYRIIGKTLEGNVVYVGQTLNLARRVKEHFCRKDRRVYKDLIAKSNQIFVEILDYCKTKQSVDKREKKRIHEAKKLFGEMFVCNTVLIR